MRVKGPVVFLLMALSVAAASLLAPTQIRAGVGEGTADAKTDALAAEANSAYEAKDWGKAATLYGELSKQENAPPRVWLRLGASLRSLSKYDDALAAFDKATQAGAGLFGGKGESAGDAAMEEKEKGMGILGKGG